MRRHLCPKLYLMQQFLFFKVDKVYIKLRFADILYVQAEKKYVNLVSIDKCYTTLCSIGHIEKILPTDIFCKVHRSYIVSLEHTIKFDNDFIYIGNKKIPISEQYRSVLKNSVITLNCELTSCQSENSFAPSQPNSFYKISFLKNAW
jgi:DNA-binding LytR/AlgR family response regulator